MVAAATGFILSVLWPGWPGMSVGPNAPALPVTVAGTAFNVPPAAIRVSMQRQPGAHERLDLTFLWPSLQPPDGTPLPNVPTKGLPKAQPFERVFVTIAAARDALPPDERVKTIYPRYLEPDAVAGPEGLSMMTFRQGTPYQGEDLIYDAAAPEQFSGSLQPQRRRLHARHVPSRQAHRRCRRDGALPARLAGRLAFGRRQYRAADCEAASAGKLNPLPQDGASALIPAHAGRAGKLLFEIGRQDRHLEIVRPLVVLVVDEHARR